MGKRLLKVSIVLPTYNGARYIRQSIDSCLTQTYKNIELIIVDDGSTDETPEIIKSYEDKRIKYLRHKKNKGLPSALNRGFARASGKYLTWTSDDNYYAEEAIEKMLNFLIEEDCLFVYCDFYTFEDDNPFEKKYIKMPSIVNFKHENCVGACFLYSKQIKETIGNYDPTAILVEDYDYWIRVSKQFPMYHLSEPLYFYRIHNKSLYSSHYYEVQISKLLTRLKYDIMDINQITLLFVNLYAKKKKYLYRINKLLGGILLSQKINRVLKEFKKRELNLKETKRVLKHLLKL